MTPLKKITLPAQIESLAACTAFIRQCASRAGLAHGQISHLDLALEEVLVNICHYANLAGAAQVEIGCSLEDGQGLLVEIVDGGPPFNPLETPEPDLATDLANRPVGGLGIYLVKTIIDKVDYQRRNGHNVLRLQLELPATTSQTQELG